MKRLTFMLIAATFAAVGFAQKPLANAEVYAKTNEAQLLQNAGVVKAPRALPSAGKMMKTPRKAAEDFVVISEQPEGELKTYSRGGNHYYQENNSMYYGAQSGTIDIVWAADNKVYFKDIVSGIVTDGWVEGTLSEDGTTITVPLSQNLVYVANYDACIAIQLIKYDNDNGFAVDTETQEVTFTVEDDVLSLQGTGLSSVSLGAVWTDDGYIQDYGDFESVYTPYEAPDLVTVPEGVEILPYVLVHDDGSASVNVAVDGNDVYFQGMSYYIPDAWVKGTKDGNIVTFSEMQYMGEYGSYGSSYFFYNGKTVFTYDAEAGTYSAEGQVYGVLADTYYDGNYTNPVLIPVVEKAAVPANPAITSLLNGNYGWYFTFNVPAVDVDGNGLVTSKLYYMFYTDVEGEIAPLTFTPETHTRLTEAMVEFPFGFTENWDFYDNAIYLNELYSEDWNNLGIQSVYAGGGELNASPIQWFHIKDYATPVDLTETTFNFNAMDVATSNNSNEGDITETLVLTEGGVKLAVSPKEEGKTTENRFWSTNAGPQLRVYSGTLTFSVPDGNVITKIDFSNNGKWNPDNSADTGEFEGTVWTGEAQVVVVSIAGNTQINSIVVTTASNGGGGNPDPEVAIDPDGITYTFDDGTLEGWTTIDADGDGYNWMNTSEYGNLSAHNGSQYAVFSQSYANDTPLTPDNYLVSPKVKLGSTFSFFAVAQDAAYPEEHFGVFVSTSGKDVENFEEVESWTLKAIRHNAKTNGPRKVQGQWYQYIIDMSAYEGQEGYVAIRHYNCTDMFYMLVDDITFGEPAEPDPIIVNELVVLPEGVEPTAYTLTAAGATSQGNIGIEQTANVAFDGTDVYLQGLAYYFPEAYVKGTLTGNQVVVPSGQFVGEDEYGVEYIVALGVDEESYFLDAENFVFDYDAETGELSLAEDNYYGESGTKGSDGLWDYFDSATYTVGALVLPDVVVAPEGLTTDTWYLSCNSYNGKIRGNELQIGVDGTDMYIQGLCEYLPEAWVKGTIDGNTVTFASGQFYGLYADKYKLFFVGYDANEEVISDVAFSIDEENQTMTTDQYIVLNSKADDIDMYDYYSDVVISTEMPALPQIVVAPEDLVTETYQFKGYDTYYNEDVTSEVQVGFYGENLVYIQGLSSYVDDAWVVGTIENGLITIPETYLGIYSSWFGDSEVFFSGTTFVYDAEAGTFTSEDGYETYETINDEYWMDEYINVVLTKINDVAATPADPVITGIKTVGVTYPKVTFTIPTEDVNGAPLIQDKLAYQIFVEKNGEVTPLVLTTDIYEELTEDMSEIPYGFSDGWDIYTSTVYLNQGEEEFATWTKIGIQTIYYGGGEVNKSNIVWQGLDTPVTITDALYATYVAPCDVDFTDSEVEAFTVVVNEVTGCASLLPVTTVPAGTAVVVKANDYGTFVAYKTTGAVLGAENELVAATEDVVADGTQYILANGANGIGFYKATEGTTIAEGKGYLPISGEATIKGFYPISDNATGIYGIYANKDEVIYNLAGQRVNKALKGVNIVNGKKVMVK